MEPFALLREARKAVPAVRFALGVAGVAAAVALVVGVIKSPAVAVFGTIIMLGLMFVLLVFSSIARKTTSPITQTFAHVLTGFFVLMIMVTTIFLFTSTFFSYPRPINQLLVITPPTHTPNVSPDPGADAQDIYTFDFNPPSPVTLTGDNIEITASIKDKSNNNLTVPISWELKDSSDSRYIDIYQRGNTVRIIKKAGAAAAADDGSPLVIGLAVSAQQRGRDLTDEINLIVPPAKTSGALDERLLTPPPPAQPHIIEESLASLMLTELGGVLPPVSRLALSQGVGITFQVLRSGGAAGRATKTPVVYIMDNRSRVYSAVTDKNKATNANDIDLIIRDLPIDSRVETVSPEWHREQAIVNADPDLIIMHWHTFCFKTSNCNSNEDRFPQFLAYVAKARRNVKFLVYSRVRSIEDREPYGKKRYLFIQKYKEQLRRDGLEIDDVIDRVYPFHVQSTPNSFCTPATALSLKSEVRRLLSLP
jgi:hypothetical protein